MANKVWVAVVPNTKNFASDVRKFLNRIEKALTLTVDVQADTRAAEKDVRASVERMAQQAVTLNVDADTSRAERRVKDLTKSRDATINVDADTGLASTQIAYAARNRRVELAVSVSKASLAAVGTALAALSGARVAQTALSRLGTSLSNLDRSVPAIAGLAMTIGSLGSVALSSVSGIVTMGAALAPLAALAAPLPGLLLAGGAAVGVFAAAMADAGTQLGSLKGGFSALQDSISGAFWAKAKQPILDLVNGVLPSLQKGLTKVAASLGTWSSSVAKSFQAAFSPSVIGTITSKLAAGIVASTQGTDAFASSLASLGTFAAQYLPGIGDTFSNLSIRFNDFIQTVVSNGQLAGWVQEASAVVGQLGAVFSNTFGILGNIADAAFAAGGSGLQTLASGLAAINQVTASPVFQGALTTFFQGAAAGASGLAAAIGPIGQMFVGLAPALSGALAGLGSTAGALISGIASALNQPIVAAGIESAVSGIAVGVQGLLPALPALGSALGSVMGLVGTLASTLGPVLGAALGAIAPVISSLATSIQPVIAMLGPALAQAIGIVAPVVQQLAAAFMPLVGAILPVLSSALGAIMPVLASLMPVFSAVVGALTPLVSAILPVLQAALAAIMPALSALLPVFASLIPPIVAVVQVLAAALVPVITALGPLIMAAVSAVLPIVQQLAGVFMQLMPTLMQLIPPIVSIATTLTSILIPVFQAVMPVVSAVISAVVPIVQSLATVISGVVNVIAGLLSGNFSQAWKGAQQIVSGVMGVISGVVTGAIGIVRSVITAGVNVVRSVISSVFGALGGLVSGGMSAMGSAVSSGISTVISFFSSLPGKILSAVSAFGSLLVSVGRNLMQGFINGVSGFASRMISAVTAPIKGAIDGAKNLLGIHSPSRVFRKIGQYTGQGLEQGLKGSTSGVRSAMRTMTNAVLSEYDRQNRIREQARKTIASLSDGNNPLRKTAAGRAEIARRISAANAEIAGQKFSDSQMNSALRAINLGNERLNKGAERRAKVADRLKAANAALTKATKARDDYKNTVMQGLSKVDVTDSSTTAGIIDQLQRRVSQTKAFTKVMASLRKAGLDDASYKQFIAEGVTSLPLAENLLAGGKGQIKQIASLQGQLAKASSSFAKTASDDLYGAGVNAAKGIVKGLQSQQAAIGKQMQAIAKSMVGSIRKALGIHSPSRVFANDVGRWIPAGIGVGVKRNAGDYQSSLDRMLGYTPSAKLTRAISLPSSSAGASAAAGRTYAPVFQYGGERFTEQKFLNAMHQIEVLTG
ncbi:phage tail protein [Curtobacterium sp. VKM Ac-2884]|uniref:phage tail protein n=1 Tax=Curtobacterium sp. VKM Ac-2884 TaxID=2783818 RepID=UPI00188C585A|nr:hypothetical protein [Curtobacterium sp. VKM Ac-2884]MBF4603767.1 hypothetical protein [Curtobacterium sp. VKM Ac-2884]